MFKKKQRRFLQLIYRDESRVYIICKLYTIVGTLVKYEL